MNNIYLALTLSTLLITLSGYTDEGAILTETSINTQSIETTPFIEYNNRVSFLPLHVGYERIKPSSLYWGLDSWAVLIENKSKGLLVDAEFRMGYNFFYNGRDHFTPFAGAGFLKDCPKNHPHLNPGFVYGTIGFLYDHEFTNIFNMGINIKGLFGSPVGRERSYWGCTLLGADVALPITLRFGHHRNWDYRIEPFNTYLHGTHAYTNYVGLRNSIGYRF